MTLTATGVNGLFTRCSDVCYLSARTHGFWAVSQAMSAVYWRIRERLDHKSFAGLNSELVAAMSSVKFLKSELHFVEFRKATGG